MNAEFFRSNRARTLERLDGDLLVIGAYDKMQQTNDAAAPFVQEANFWWLTGIKQPGWRMMLDGGTGKAALIAPTLTQTEMVFDSYLTAQEATALSGIENVIDSRELHSHLKNRRVYTIQPDSARSHSFARNPAPGKLYRMVKTHAKEVVSARLLLAKLRAIKQPEEIAAMKRAVDVSIAAFERVHETLGRYHSEAAIAAEFTYDFMKQGAAHAYEPIVAAGKNACTLHYNLNNAPVADGLVLLDIGAKVGAYNADITRTYAVGNTSQRHKEVHAAVAQAQADIISILQPGLKVEEYANHVDKIMQAALVGLGLMKHTNDKEKYRRYFPHAISHGLGVDVHDSLGRAEQFEPGMVLTVEPGIYIPEEGIGVRIEDDIVITKAGHQNLSASLATML